jgi:uncharacterized protein
MGENIKERMDALVRFQAIEQSIALATANLAKTAPRIKALEEGLKQFTLAIENGTAGIVDLKKRYRAYELDVQANQSKIDKSQEKLRAVKTNKEYRSSLKEIEDMESANSDIEDNMLAILDEIETAEADLAKKKDDFERESVQIQADQAELRDEADGLKKNLATLEADRAVVAGNVDVQFMETFRKVRDKQADDVGVAGVTDAICMGCHVGLPPQLYNELQRWDKMTFCPNCHRIIYWDKKEEEKKE